AIINASFSSASSALYFLRWGRGLEEILIAPLSYTEMILGLLSESLARALIVAFLILGVGSLFGAVQLQNPVMFVLYVLSISTIFASIGILVALWAESFEQLQVMNTFVITPLTYLGGIFYSITFLPELAASITRFNPFFYFVDGIRSSMIGYSEADSTIGLFVVVGLVIFLLALVKYLFSIGWKIRY
ncbi:MAG: ABC-2 type transport system permease protein, partial [Acidimicrobiales bacterium]